MFLRKLNGRCLGQSYWEQNELDHTDLSSDNILYCMLRKLEDLKTEGCASKDKLQQEIQDQITETTVTISNGSSAGR